MHFVCLLHYVAGHLGRECTFQDELDRGASVSEGPQRVQDEPAPTG